LSLIHAAANWRYAIKAFGSPRPSRYAPKVLLIVPCRGLDKAFRNNIRSLLSQDYPDYVLWFVVRDQADPAYAELTAILARFAEVSRPRFVRILVAGPCTGSSQKLHNLLYAIGQSPDDIEVFAFADSDIQAPPDWLSSLIAPLANPRVGATTGYRWFVPVKADAASIVLSCLNAKVAQMLGQSSFNLAWGGSMAVRTETFRICKIEAIWARSLADDLTLAGAIRARGLRIRFVPRSLVPSYCQVTWREFLEFGRRQFFLTRLYSPGTWLVALIGTALAIFDLWAVLGMAVCSVCSGWMIGLAGMRVPAWPIWLGAWLAFMISGLVKGIMRQHVGGHIFLKRPPTAQKAMVVDILGFWLWPILMFLLMLASAVGKTINWRGLRYRVHGPDRIEVLTLDRDKATSR